MVFFKIYQRINFLVETEEEDVIERIEKLFEKTSSECDEEYMENSLRKLMAENIQIRE